MTAQQSQWFVEFYVDARGRSAVVKFINGLLARERARVRNALRLLREFGVLLQMPHARPVAGQRGLWELRAGGDPAILLRPYRAAFHRSARLS
jgi:hypothetical protein